MGTTVPEIDLASLGPLHLATVEKTLFSMFTPEVGSLLKRQNFKSVVIFGIEVEILVQIPDLPI